MKKIGSTSARSPPTAPVKHVVQKQPLSPDPYDDLPLDMDMDESFLEQVGMIEQGALGTGTGTDNKGKGKGKDTRTEGHPSAAPARKTSSGSALGMTHLAPCPVS
jgi:hypothetical protein